jgi:hypothetical protein
MITVKTKLSVQIVGHGRKKIRSSGEVEITDETPVRRKIHRITKLMALAIRFQEMLRTGEATDMIELARRSKVSQPRISQILALNLLAPDIQQALLDLPPQSKGKPFLHEKRIRPIAAILDWSEQRRVWREILAERESVESSSAEDTA